MANILPMEKQIAVVSALAEGNSIRSIERMTEVHRDTIMRLGVKVGKGCTRVLDESMRDLGCRRVQLDEIWGFIGKKQNHVTTDDSPEMGNVWTFVAIDADTKVVPCFKVGKRTLAHATEFTRDLASRLSHRVQLSSDALRAYGEAVEAAFGCKVDYGQLVKTYASTETNFTERKYSPGEVIDVHKTVIVGRPDSSKISTSYVEAQNLTMRMHIRRLHR